MLKWKTALVTFLHYSKSVDGKTDFSRKSLPSISGMEWIFVEGFCFVLTLLQRVMEYLSGEKFSTLIQALPQLLSKNGS
jgi:hypothetical protein